MAKLLARTAVPAIFVLAMGLLNGVLFPTSPIPAGQLVWTAIIVATVSFAVAWRQRQRS